jgi:hypothetical protein
MTNKIEMTFSKYFSFLILVCGTIGACITKDASVMNMTIASASALALGKTVSDHIKPKRRK